MKGKRGVEQVVGVVLLILVTIVIAAIVGYYAVNTAQKPDSSCLEALNGISFDDIGFNCKLPDSPDALSGFSVRVSNPDILGFQVGFSDDASADSYQVLEGKSYGLICSLGRHFNEPLEVPASGEVRTYVAKGNFDKMFIAPILRNGETCYSEARREVPLDVRCADSNVITSFRACDSGGVCGDGRVQASEQCDPAGSTQSCVLNNIEGTKTCNNECQWGSCETCTLTGASWSETEAYEGTVVTMTVQGTAQCNGKNMRFDIWEDDGLLPDDPVASNLQSTFNGNIATFNWETIWTPDLLPFGINYNPPEHYFKATINSGPTSGNFITSSSEEEDELKVFKCGDLITSPQWGEECDGQEGCDEYCREEPGWTCVPNPPTSVCTQDRYNICQGTSCVSVLGTGTSTCTTNTQCEATTHLECDTQNYQCIEVSGGGGNQGGCTAVGEDCRTPLSCGNNICELNLGEGGICCGDCPNSGGICNQPMVCGNRILEPLNGEECDDGNRRNNDGCSATCQIEDTNGWHCTSVPGQWSLCCNTAPGCQQNENPLCPNCNPNNGGTNPWINNPSPSCEASPGFQSCETVFGTLFGWIGHYPSTCPGAIGQNSLCQDYIEPCDQAVPAECIPGQFYPAMGVCCYANGVINPYIDPDACQCLPP